MSNNLFKSVYTCIPPHYQELLRFAMVGGFLTLGWSVAATLLNKYTDLSIEVVATLAYLIMLGFGYFSQRVITFRANNNHAKAFLSYAAVQTVGLIIAIVLSNLLLTNFKLPEHLERFNLGEWSQFISFLIVGGLTAVLNYVLLKYWTFKKQKSE